MWRNIAESDWKRLSKLKPLVLDRLCHRILEEIAVAAADSGSYYDRYLAIFDIVQKRDREIADAFDELSRSKAYERLGVMRSLNLISDEEFSGFSKETQEIVKLFGG